MSEWRVADWSNALILAGTIGIAGLSSGCTTSLSPLKPESIIIDHAGTGLVFGRIHLLYNGNDQRTGLRVPATLDWWMSDDPQGRSFVVRDLPIDGSFVLKLPLGRYRITGIEFQDVLGKWKVSLPGMFTVEPGCTYLGTWELRFQVEMLAGHASGEVVDQRELLGDDMNRIPQGSSCPLAITLLEATPHGSLRLSRSATERD